METIDGLYLLVILGALFVGLGGGAVYKGEARKGAAA